MEKEYVAGSQYRVLKDGARFEGLLLFGEQSISGWSREIKQGEILTCLGWKEAHVFGTDIAGVMWTGVKVPDNAMVMQIWPFESLFRPIPLKGLLGPYEVPKDELGELQELTEIETPREEEIDEGHVVDLTSHLPELQQVTKKSEESDEPVDLTGF